MEKKTYLKDIAGYDEAKKEAAKIIEVLRNYEKYKEEGVTLPKGLILAGCPGVGKTMLARAIANESDAPFYEYRTCKGKEGESDIENLRKVFKEAKEHQPSIVFIDEIDQIVTSGVFASDSSRQMNKALLGEIDGLSSSEGTLVIATTNCLPSIDLALTGSGRMDKRIMMDNPDYKTRELICALYLKKHKIFESIEPKDLAKKTIGFCGADIKTLVNETLLDLVSSGKKEATISDFDDQIQSIRFADLKHPDQEADKSTIYHELGHAVLTYELTKKAPSVCVERIGKALGFTVHESTLDILKLSKSQILDQISIALGGMAAEEVFVGETSTGSSNDVEKANDLCDLMAKSGMFGFDCLVFEQPRYSYREPKVSEERMAKIEAKKAETLTKAYFRAKILLKDESKLVECLFKELQANKKLSSEELESLIEAFRKEKKGDEIPSEEVPNGKASSEAISHPQA